MNKTALKICAKTPLGRFHSKLYKELENINFRSELETEASSGDILNVITIAANNVRTPTKNSSKDIHKAQYEMFKETMKVLLFLGQCLGLNPVLGVFQRDVFKIRFKYCSWRFMYSVLICGTQAVATFLCFYRLLSQSVDINMLASVCFYGSTYLTTFLFIRVAIKWPVLVHEVASSDLDQYTDPRVKIKCNVAFIILLSMACVEHILSLIVRITQVFECNPESIELYRKFSEVSFPWLFELDVPYHLAVGFVLQLINVISTINWSFSDLFIIYISIYLTSLLKKVNEKIIDAKGKSLPPAFWRSLRGDYTRATQLVRSFDEVISSVIFSSFAANLFFICLQLFNVLANGIKTTKNQQLQEDCSNYDNGPFGGYEDAVYFCFSLAFIVGRSLFVSLIAASVHSASLVAAHALYSIPAAFYCDEIGRFIEQVHGDTVALSGLQFFYITKELVLSIAGTIVTYELVLLQFNGEELIHKS